MTEGIVLFHDSNDFESDIRTGDYVCIDKYEKDIITYGKFLKIDEHYMTTEINPYKYIVYTNSGIMNFMRNEISIIYPMVFDAKKYYDKGKLVLLGKLDDSDILKLKYRALLEHDDYTMADIHKIELDEIIGYTFYGDIEPSYEKSIENDNIIDKVDYFKLKKIEDNSVYLNRQI